MRARRALVAGIFLGLGAAATTRCGSTATPAVDAGLPDAVMEGSLPDNQPAKCQVPKPPAVIPSGWALAKNVDPCCGFYMPTALDQMPPPIRWETCRSDHVPVGSVCRQMAIDWDRDPKAGPLGVEYRAAQVQPDGNVSLVFDRISKDGVMEIVADSDGPVRFALIGSKYGCIGTLNALRDGTYGMYVDLPGPGDGELVGSLSQLAPAAIVVDQPNDSWLPGSPGVLHVGQGQTMDLVPWDQLDGGGAIHISSPSEEDGRQQSMQFFQGDAIFWNSSTLWYHGFRVWTPKSGKQTFMDYGTDTSRGLGGLGTDGVDLVWNDGESRTNPNDVFPITSVMTSPYTTDEKALKPRKVRVTGSYGAVTPYRVGCGYAAHSMGLTASDAFVEVVRLSDGTAWRVDPKVGTWAWAAPIALTCDEIFVWIQSKGPFGYYEQGIARIRLDSLGPGIPP